MIYSYLVKYYNCLSEKQGEKKNSLVSPTYTCSQIILANIPSSYAPINVMPKGGGPRDRVGTLIKNKNLESNFLTLGIRFQFKVPQPGKRF